MNSVLQRQDIINCLKDSNKSFVDKALDVYHYQKNYNPIYKRFLQQVGGWDSDVLTLEDITFLPIGFFKSHRIQTGNWNAEQIFRSSGTTQMSRSQHLVRDLDGYHQNAAFIWEQRFGKLEDYLFLSLLPNYHENPASSLLSMVAHFIQNSKKSDTHYFLNDQEQLYRAIESCKREGTKVVLFGVSFALLDYAAAHSHQELEKMIVVETGGMKKFRKEVTREELHKMLGMCFGRAEICSEYGMSECSSQMYTTTNRSDLFEQNRRMHILISDPTDPFCFLPKGRVGRINIVDLANFDTMSFIATDDLGRQSEDGSIQILGRMSNAELRGCNYLI